MAGLRSNVSSPAFGALLDIQFDVSPKGSIFDYAAGYRGEKGKVAPYKQAGDLAYTQTMIDNLVSMASHKMALVAVDKIKKALEKGGQFKVGASGGAAAAVDTYVVGMQGDAEIWGVVEDGSTPANAAIRFGIQPEETSPPIMRLADWARAKGIQLKYESKSPKLIFSRSKTGKRYFRAKAGSRKPAMRALFALKKAIEKGGSFRATSDWRRYTPGREGKFDYVTWAVEQLYDDQWQDAVNKLGSGVTAAIVRYMAGDQKGGGVRTIWNMG